MNKVTVIVPVYKAEKYLNRCVDSLVRQTYSNIEIILIDDGSPDMCPQICDQYSLDNRIKVIHKVNEGVQEARNEALRIADSKWVAFIDADDWVEDDYVERLVNEADKGFDVVIIDRIDEYENTSVPIQKYDKEHVFETEEELRKLHASVMSTAAAPDFEPVSRINLGAVWDKLYLLSIIRDNMLSFDKTARITGDVLFNLTYFKFIHSASYIHYYGCHYNMVGESITKSFDKERANKVLHTMQLIGTYVEQNKTKELQQGYYLICIVSFIETLYRYYFSSLNRIKMTDKLLAVRHMINNSTFMSAFSGIDVHLLNERQKIMVWTCKKQHFFLLYMLCYLNMTKTSLGF